LSHSASSFYMMGFFEIGSHELFAWVGFKLWSTTHLISVAWVARITGGSHRRLGGFTSCIGVYTNVKLSFDCGVQGWYVCVCVCVRVCVCYFNVSCWKDFVQPIKFPDPIAEISFHHRPVDVGVYFKNLFYTTDYY
jgi:hypothetical protein